MSKHTQGPWDFVVADNAERPSVFVVDGNGDPIARMTRGITGQAQADAVLIAAAPDLFMACHAALAYLADPPSKYKEIRDEATRIIRDAIRKAVSED